MSCGTSFEISSNISISISNNSCYKIRSWDTLSSLGSNKLSKSFWEGISVLNTSRNIRLVIMSNIINIVINQKFWVNMILLSSIIHGPGTTSSTHLQASTNLNLSISLWMVGPSLIIIYLWTSQYLLVCILQQQDELFYLDLKLLELVLTYLHVQDGSSQILHQHKLYILFSLGLS